MPTGVTRTRSALPMRSRIAGRRGLRTVPRSCLCGGDSVRTMSTRLGRTEAGGRRSRAGSTTTTSPRGPPTVRMCCSRADAVGCWRSGPCGRTARIWCDSRRDHRLRTTAILPGAGDVQRRRRSRPAPRLSPIPVRVQDAALQRMERVISTFDSLEEAVRASFTPELCRIVAVREHGDAAMALFDTRPSAAPYLYEVHYQRENGR